MRRRWAKAESCSPAPSEALERRGCVSLRPSDRCGYKVISRAMCHVGEPNQSQRVDAILKTEPFRLKRTCSDRLPHDLTPSSQNVTADLVNAAVERLAKTDPSPESPMSDRRPLRRSALQQPAAMPSADRSDFRRRTSHYCIPGPRAPLLECDMVNTPDFPETTDRGR